MEAAFKVVCDLCDIRHIGVFFFLVVLFSELELYLVTEEVFEDEVHEFGVGFLFEVLVGEHEITAAN